MHKTILAAIAALSLLTAAPSQSIIEWGNSNVSTVLEVDGSISTTWTDTSGQMHTVTTPVPPNATNQQFKDALAKHIAQVMIAQMAWPPQGS